MPGGNEAQVLPHSHSALSLALCTTRAPGHSTLQAQPWSPQLRAARRADSLPSPRTHRHWTIEATFIYEMVPALPTQVGVCRAPRLTSPTTGLREGCLLLLFFQFHKWSQGSHKDIPSTKGHITKGVPGGCNGAKKSLSPRIGTLSKMDAGHSLGACKV